MQVTPSSAASTDVSGTATLTGGTVNAQFASGSYLAKQYTILSATRRVRRHDIRQPDQHEPAGRIIRQPELQRQHCVSEPPGGTGRGSGLNQNQQNVANALNNFFNSGGTLPPNFVSVFGLTGGSLANALRQLDGEAATGAERAVIQLTNEFLELMLDPFVNGRGNVGGLGGGAIGFAPDEQASLPPDIALAYASIITRRRRSRVFEQRWTAWGTAYGGSNSANGNAAVGSNNVDRAAPSASPAAWIITSRRIRWPALRSPAPAPIGGSPMRWALAAATPSRPASMASAGSVRPMLPARWLSPITGSRPTASRWAISSPRTSPARAMARALEGGYRYAVLPAFGVTPYGALQAQDFHTPAYSETDVTGGGFGLTYAATNATDVRTELGARFDDPTLIYGKPLILFGRLAWAHDLGQQSCAQRSVPIAAGRAASRSTARRSRRTRR